jgi:hypothetical protein
VLDRIGLNVELIPNLFSSLQPTGQRGLYAYWRNTSKVLSANAFATLTGSAHRQGAGRQDADVGGEGTVEPCAEDRESRPIGAGRVLERAAAVSIQDGGQQQLKHKQLSKAITGAANNGSGLIRITAVAHTFRNEDRVTITGVGGTVEANAANWRVAFVSANTFDLKSSTFTNAYTSGGTAKRTQG